MLGCYPLSGAALSAMRRRRVAVQQEAARGGDGWRGRKRLIEETAEAQSQKWDKRREEQEDFRNKIATLYEKIQNGYEAKDEESKVIIEEYVSQKKSHGQARNLPEPRIDFDRLLQHADHLHRLLVEYEIMKLREQEEIVILMLAL